MIGATIPFWTKKCLNFSFFCDWSVDLPLHLFSIYASTYVTIVTKISASREKLDKINNITVKARIRRLKAQGKSQLKVHIVIRTVSTTQNLFLKISTPILEIILAIFQHKILIKLLYIYKYIKLNKLLI